ncbi:DUF7024 domain-containing protein [Duganella violaceipulchra]|uniref:Glycosyltransferase family 39 protein n=1 Tax=Duganella violaceipulchra TaxID=2849652 RepID=A0AA41L2J7_9BURK|nr:glycosyltransferase family 39 protein [Duganella violaceicalia]MBV6320424.1 glycosyltransferase family 39 protein [Duganella violaceicalia]MCP2012259.1 phosphoglycerol transferase [Duganella violaceicalia]
MKPLPPLEKNLFSSALLPALLLVFCYLFLRNSGIYPIVFIDEWSYSSNTRLLPLSAAQVPSYLYFSLFKLTNYCGDGFLDCNRMLNTVLYLLAAPFIYLLGKRLAPAPVAALLALAAALSPNNAYTPFFMPEAMYFLAFWVYSWASMAFYQQPTLARAAALGALLGLMAMVKMHALFLIPSLCVFLAFVAFDGRAADSGWRWLRRAAALALVAVLSALAARMLVGWALAGRPGLSLFGPLYAEQAAYTAKAHVPLLTMAGLALHNLQGHMISLAVLFGVPLAALPAALLLGARSQARAMVVYSVLVLGSLLAVTVLFTASITGLAEGDTAARIHTRYYNFALPLMLLCGAALLYAPAAAALKLRWRLLAGGAVLALVVWGRYHLLHSYAPTIIDSAEMRAFSLNAASFNTMAGLALLALLAWIWRPQLGLRLFLFAALPVTTLYCAANTAHEVRLSIHADAYTKAGLFARHYLSREQADGLTVVATEIGGLLRTKFFIENTNVALLEVPRNATEVDWASVPDSTQLVLLVGAYQPPAGARIIARKDDMALFELPPAEPGVHLLRFSRPLSGGYVLRTSGLSGPEPWGSWTDGPEVRIEFAAPLAKRLRLRLTGHAFGPNVGREVVVTLGGQQQRLRWTEQTAQTTLEFDTDGAARTLAITIPQPASPTSLGQNGDTRALGIALERISVEDRELATP